MKRVYLNISARKRTRLAALFVAGVIGLIAIGGDLTWTAFAGPGTNDDKAITVETNVDLDSLYSAKTEENPHSDSSSIAFLDPLRTIEGHVSWYGSRFHGRRTANGERFDMHRMTAAHKTLPFNTLVRVQDENTGKAVLVRINDRGPYVRGRVLDLSRQAAERLGMKSRGFTEGQIEIYPETTIRQTVTTASQGAKSQSSTIRYITFGSDVKGVHPDGWSVQIGTFDIFDEAIDLHNSLVDEYDNVFLTRVVQGKKRFYIVSVGLMGAEVLSRDLLIELAPMYGNAAVVQFQNGFPVQDYENVAVSMS